MNLLLFSHPGHNSRSIFLDCARGLEQAGHRLFFFELEPLWGAIQQEPAARPRILTHFTAHTQAFIAANRIDACLGMWLNPLLAMAHPSAGGQPVSFFDAAKVPCALFWLDAPQWALAGESRAHFRSPILQGPMLLSLINNPQTAREMTTVLGFGNVLPVPCGVNESLFRPHQGEPKEFDIVFGCGPGDPAPTPLALKELESDDPNMQALRLEAAESLRPVLTDLASKSGPHAPALAEVFRLLLDAQLANRAEPMLDRLARFRADATLDPAIDHLLSTPTLFIDATMRTRAVERAERAFTISWLSRRFSCATFGPADFSAWACRARAFGPVAYEDQPRLYSRGRFGLNVMRWQDDAGLNLKCYEITASGAACLLARRPGLEELFDPHSEVAAFDSPRHAATLARELLDSPRRLQALAESGRARTLRDHTWTSWARAVAETLARMRS